jgi:hypothetical protein
LSLLILAFGGLINQRLCYLYFQIGLYCFCWQFSCVWYLCNWWFLQTYIFRSEFLRFLPFQLFVFFVSMRFFYDYLTWVVLFWIYRQIVGCGMWVGPTYWLIQFWWVT